MAGKAGALVSAAALQWSPQHDTCCTGDFPPPPFSLHTPKPGPGALSFLPLQGQWVLWPRCPRAAVLLRRHTPSSPCPRSQDGQQCWPWWQLGRNDPVSLRSHCLADGLFGPWAPRVFILPQHAPCITLRLSSFYLHPFTFLSSELSFPIITLTVLPAPHGVCVRCLGSGPGRAPCALKIQSVHFLWYRERLSLSGLRPESRLSSAQFQSLCILVPTSTRLPVPLPLMAFE